MFKFRKETNSRKSTNSIKFYPHLCIEICSFNTIQISFYTNAVVVNLFIIGDIVFRYKLTNDNVTTGNCISKHYVPVKVT